MNKQRLAEIEEYLLGVFRRERSSKLLTKLIFDSAGGYANADMVRAIEDLEKSGRLLVRYTEEGDDWVQLTPAGVSLVGLSQPEETAQPKSLPHPPKSST